MKGRVKISSKSPPPYPSPFDGEGTIVNPEAKLRGIFLLK